MRINNQVTKEAIEKIVELDKLVYSNIEINDAKRVQDWVSVEPNVFTLLWKGSELVGYFNLLPLKKMAYNKVLAGKLRDYNISAKELQKFKKGENYCLLQSIVVKKEYRDGQAIMLLWQGFVDKIEKLKEQGIEITSIVADCVSVDGIKYMVNNFQSRYVCNSHGGKIYEGKMFSTDRPVPKLEYHELTKENVKIAGKLQYDIFNKYEEVGYLDFKDETKVKNRLKRRLLPLTYLAYHEGEPAGFIGLYEYEEYPDDVWINWLGVREDKRRKGIGTQLLFKIAETARLYDKKNLRLQTYKNLNHEAQSIYRKVMQIVESYTNEKDNKFNNDEVLIYSLSLKDKTAPYWNNKFIDINDEYRLHFESIKELKKDKVIE